MNQHYVAGLMSGTSVDGIDAVLARVRGSGEQTEVDVVDFLTVSYPNGVREKIFQAMDPEASSTPLICSLNFELGYYFAAAVKKVCEKARFDLDQLDLIGSHGQTIYHMPNKSASNFISTLQIGEPAVIAYQTKTPVVSNFRVMDMAAGGQGAPLVPYMDYLLFHNSDRAVALQNIGGIANITVLPKGYSMNDTYAFDTGPGNMIIDEWTSRFYGCRYDPDGKYAAAGRVNQKMLESMMSDPYIHQKPPKTTGRERFGKAYADQLLDQWKHLPANDLIATATYFTAQSIAANIKKWVLKKDPIEELMISGGGSHNKTLIKWLQELLPDITVKMIDEYGIRSDAKEAVAFALLANEMVHHRPANIPRVTGADKHVVLGSLTPYDKTRER